MFARPHAGIYNKFELSLVELQQCREAVKIDGLKKLEEFDAEIGVFMEVLVDHLESAFKDTFHNGGNLVIHHVLYLVSINILEKPTIT